MKPWLKLWHEIVDDPKMGMMSDRLWRRTVELFLIASKRIPIDDGSLPPVSDIAWALRTTPEHLETELVELSKLGVLSRVDGVWWVRNYLKRQAPMDDAARAKWYRKRQKAIENYEASRIVTYGITDRDGQRDEIVTLTVQEQEQEQEQETETEQEQEQYACEAESVDNLVVVVDELCEVGELADELSEGLEEIGFVGGGQWLAALGGREQWQLVRLWLTYLDAMNGDSRKKIKSPGALVRAKVEKGEEPPKISRERQQQLDNAKLLHQSARR